MMTEARMLAWLEFGIFVGMMPWVASAATPDDAAATATDLMEFFT